MVELIQQHRHFLHLIKSTTTAQRKALLSTITKQQLKALSQIAYNILRFKIRLTPSEKAQLKRQRRIIHLLGNRSIGFKQKREAIQHKPRVIYTLVKITFAYLEPVLA
jgi:hypothetical protein